MTIQLALVPRDALFCKDGRGWFTSETGRGHALEWPYPSTVRGALRAVWGRRREAHLGRALSPGEWRDQTSPITLGRTLALRRRWSGKSPTWERIWPLPADVLISESGRIHRLDPRPLVHVGTLGRVDPHDPTGARERLWTARPGKVKPGERPRWWSERQLLPWLSEPAASGPSPADEPAPRLPRRLQTHVCISSSTHTAVEEMLFSHELVEMIDRQHEWAIGCEVEFPSDAYVDMATLGSDSRLARVEPIPAPIFDPPHELMRAFERKPRGLRLMVVTPCAFEQGWLPSGFACVPPHQEFRGWLPGVAAELILRAALVDRPVGVSGWDIERRRPKPTTRMVPPGSVYMFVRVDGQPFTSTEARALWLAAHGERTDEGFGRIIPGVWNPAS